MKYMLLVAPALLMIGCLLLIVKEWRKDRRMIRDSRIKANRQMDEIEERDAKYGTGTIRFQRFKV